MGDKPNRAKVSVALVGIGPTWELHYRDAIERLSSKLHIRAVCDSVVLRAASVAEEFDATAVTCPWNLVQRNDLHAWLILDPGWFETYPADLAARHGRPALFANTFTSPLPRLTRVIQRSMERGETLMPEFPARFTPSTTRLRELMATKLGRVQEIQATLPSPASAATSLTELNELAEWMRQNQAELISLFDWCAWLIGSPCTEVRFHMSPSGPQWELQFAPRSGTAEPPPVAFIGWGADACQQVKCEAGTAILGSTTQIAWKTAAEEHQEILSGERSPYEIILDQFCRRALGGLVPVPTLAQALQAITTAERAYAAISAFERAKHR